MKTYRFTLLMAGLTAAVLIGTFASAVKDPSGNIVFTASGDYNATRIHVQP